MALRLGNYEQGFSSAAWHCSGDRRSTCSNLLGARFTLDSRLLFSPWTPPSPTCAWIRSVAFLGAAPTRPPCTARPAKTLLPPPGQRDHEKSFISVLSCCQQSRGHPDDALPQTASPSTRSSNTEQERRQEAAFDVDSFIIPSPRVYPHVKRRRWKRPQWKHHIQALRSIAKRQYWQADASSQPPDDQEMQSNVSKHLLDCVHELRRISDARGGCSDSRMLDYVQVRPASSATAVYCLDIRTEAQQPLKPRRRYNQHILNSAA